MIVFPIFCMVFLTFIVGICVGGSRLRSIKKRQVDARYYRLMAGDTPPEYVAKLGRNFSNLFEVPVLFYVLSVLVIALNITSVVVLTLAWLFVLLRVIHSVIHMTYNHPLHRFLVFLASNVVLMVAWGVVVYRVSIA